MLLFLLSFLSSKMLHIKRIKARIGSTTQTVQHPIVHGQGLRMNEDNVRDTVSIFQFLFKATLGTFQWIQMRGSQMIARVRLDEILARKQVFVQTARSRSGMSTVVKETSSDKLELTPVGLVELTSSGITHTAITFVRNRR